MLPQHRDWCAHIMRDFIVCYLPGFIKVCSVATPSSNPNKPKAKTMSLRRQPRNNPGYRNEPPPAYDIEMSQRNGRNGRNQGRNGR